MVFGGGEHAISGAGYPPAHDVTQPRHAQVEADRLAVRAVVLHQLVYAALGAFGDYRERVGLAPLVGGPQALGDVGRGELALGQRDHLRTAEELLATRAKQGTVEVEITQEMLANERAFMERFHKVLEEAQKPKPKT